MKRIVGLLVVLIGLCNCCCANVLEFGSKIFDYDANRNCFVYSYMYNITNTDTKTKVSDVTFLYLKEYDFNKAYNIQTRLCSPYQAICIMVTGKEDTDLRDDITMLESVNNNIYPIDIAFEKTFFGDGNACYFGEIDLADVKFFRKLIEDEQELVFVLTVGTTEAYLINLTKEKVKEMKMVMQYDLLADTSQKENVAKAIAVANEFKSSKNE